MPDDIRPEFLEGSPADETTVKPAAPGGRRIGPESEGRGGAEAERADRSSPPTVDRDDD